MYIEFSTYDCIYRFGERATHPIAPRYGTLAALLLLVGTSSLRRRVLPAHRIAAHSGVFNCRIKVESSSHYQIPEPCASARFPGCWGQEIAFYRIGLFVGLVPWRNGDSA